MRNARFILLFALLLPLAFSQAINRPELVTSAKVIIEESGTVTANGGQMRDLTINISIPYSESYQKVTSDPAFTDSEGNRYLSISSSNPQNPFTYSKQVEVENTGHTVTSLPENYVVPNEYFQYLKATPRTDSDNPRIKALAEQITAGAQDPFEKAAKIAIWVNKYLTYDERKVGQENNALTVLDEKTGVCVEYSTLFTALARASGIPTRYVLGYVYSSIYSGWLGHAWNEVYIGQWVPVDSTWMQAGSTDALHIEGARVKEISHEPTLTARVSPPSAKIIWDTPGRSGALANNVRSVSIESRQPYSGFTLAVADSELAPGGTTLAYLTLQGEDYRVIPVSLAPCSGSNAVAVEGGEQFLVLRPGKKATAAWIITAPEGVPKNYIYSCPLTLNSPYLENRVVEVRTDPRMPRAADFTASLKSSAVPTGSENSVLITTQDKKGGSFVVVAKDGIYSASILGANGEIPFSSFASGNSTIYVASRNGGVRTLGLFAGANSTVLIDFFSLPRAFILGREAKVKVSLSSQSYPAAFELELAGAGAAGHISGMMSSPSEYEISLTPADEGESQLSLRAISKGSVSQEENSLIEVQPAPSVRISGISTRTAAGGLSTILSFSHNGNPVSPKARIGDFTYPADFEIEAKLSEGRHIAELSWYDSAGNHYTENQEIDIEKPGIFENIKTKTSPASGSQSGCPLPLVVIFLVAAAYAFRR